MGLTPQVVPINPRTQGSRPISLLNINGTLYFSANDDKHIGLWKTDGTTAGTHLVDGITPANSYFGPANLTNVNGTIFFSGDDGIHGDELWKSDGTTNGTVLLGGGASPSDLINLNGTLMFTLNPGNGLWRSDGTAQGTIIVDSSLTQVADLTNVYGTLFFSANDGIHGQQLWKSDGTPNGTAMVTDIPGFFGAGFFPSLLTIVNHTLFLSGIDRTYGTELWKSDGTASGTVQVADINPGSAGSYPTYLTNVNGTLFFTAYDGSHGVALWKSDGSANGTVAVAGFTSGRFQNRELVDFANLNGTLFFSAYDGAHGQELWKSDGTTIGTVLVKDINPGPSGSYPSYLTNVNDTLFFTSTDGKHGSEVWKSDGTTSGTLLIDINPGLNGSYPLALINVNGTLFFRADDGTHGNELMKVDGATNDAVLVDDINLAALDSSATNLANINGTLFLSATDGVHGNELWRTDGTADGTVLVADINPGPSGSYPSYLTNVNGMVFFTANDGTHGRALWRSDGTGNGTVLLDYITPASNDSFAFPDLVDVSGTLFFSVDDGIHGRELWKSDGTANGTVLVKDILPGPSGSFALGLTNVNGTLFLDANDGTHGYELWKSDGTSKGTVMVKDINPGPGDANLAGLINVNGTLFFTADSGKPAEELWKSDGTANGTVLVDVINPVSRGLVSYPYPVANVNGTLFFGADGGSQGAGLWKSDGTARGTVLVQYINPGPNGFLPYNLTNVNGTLFFSALGGIHGNELWKSDGTSNGTGVVDDISPEPGSLTNVNGTLFLVALDDVHSGQLWESDGTSKGTTMVTDINPYLSYNSGAQASQLTNVNGTLFFSAVEPRASWEHFPSRQLWRLFDYPLSAGAVTVPAVQVNQAIVNTVLCQFTDGDLAGTAAQFGATVNWADGTSNTSSDGTGTVSVVGNADGGFDVLGSHTYTKALSGASLTVQVADVQGASTSAVALITVTPGAASHFGVDMPVSGIAGTAFTVTVSALDMFGNVATGYTGTVHLSSSDNLAGLPADYQFATADMGVHTFAVTFKTAGNVTETVTDVVTSSIAGIAAVTVNPAAASVFVVASSASSTTAGIALTFMVTAQDSFGNIATAYRGTLHFSSTDGLAGLPADYQFVSTDNGIHTFAVTLKSVGSQTLTATDTIAGSVTGTATASVSPAAASHFSVTAPVTAGRGTAFTVTVTALDPFNNVATGYTGTIHFSSSDVLAILPADFTFTSADAGVHTFPGAVTLQSDGNQAVTITDVSTASITGSIRVELPSMYLATGAGAGGGPEVKVFDATTGALVFDFLAYDPRFMGGVRVVVADVNGDGVPDIITAPGPTGGPDIRIFDGKSSQMIGEFLAYGYHLDTGFFVAAADFNHDGFADIVTAPNQGGPDIRVFDGKSIGLNNQATMTGEFLAYAYSFEGGVRLAVGDVNGDGTPDLITAPGPGGGPDIRVFDGTTLLGQNQATILGEFLAYNYQFDAGVFVAAGDINGDGKAEIVTSPDQGGGPDIRVFDGNTVLPGAAPPLLNELLAYDYFFEGGARVAFLDVNGQAELATAPGPSGGADVKIFDALTAAQLNEFFAYDPAFLGGSYVGGG
jgi:ELWxxDGT repeat protein